MRTILLATVALLTCAADDVPLAPTGQPQWLLQSALQAQSLLQKATPSTITPTGQTVPALAQMTNMRNDAGTFATFFAGNPPDPNVSPFFQDLGSNGRTCVSCHQPDQGWAVTPTKLQTLFKTNPGAPVFRTVDGAGCGTNDVSNPTIAAQSYKLLLSKGLFRVFIPLPDDSIREFSVTTVKENIPCNNNPSTGLTSPNNGVLSFYRRPLPTTNLLFLTSFMWDGREPSLLSQAGDATMVHAQGKSPLTDQQKQQIVDFETTVYTAQTMDNNLPVGLNDENARGGPEVLSQTAFQPNDPNGKSFNPQVMNLYLSWINDADATKASIARGEAIFNGRQFTISNTGTVSTTATCSRCHNTPDVGNRSTSNVFNDIGVSTPNITSLDTTDLPVFSVRCDKGTSAGITTQVTDLGRAMISGKCADLGKFKVPILRALESRSPYFHNGSAGSLEALINFYDARFSIHLTDQEKADLEAFLRTL